MKTQEPGLALDVMSRRDRLTVSMGKDRIDAAIIASEGNFLYLSGYQTHSWANKARPLVLVCAQGASPVAIVSAGEAESIHMDAVSVESRPYLDPRVVEREGHRELDFMMAASDVIIDVLSTLRPKRVGFELSSHCLPGLSITALDYIRERLPRTQFSDISPVLWTLRQHKTPFEITRLHQAATVLGQAFVHFEKRAKPGLTERALHRLFIAGAADAGADQVEYTCVVAGVERALGGPRERVWQHGQLLHFDAGIRVDGYWADFSRLYVAGTPTKRQCEAYGEAVDALQAGRACVRSGISAADVAKALSGVVAAGGSAFGRVGHGIGFDLTEPPSLSSDERSVLEPGMTLCLEPNRHVAGIGYVAAEEEVAVTESGCEVISPFFPPELKVIA